MNSSEVTRRLRERALYASFIVQRNRVEAGCSNSVRLQNVGSGSFDSSLIPMIKEGDIYTTPEEAQAYLDANACPSLSTDDNVYMVGSFYNSPLEIYDNQGNLIDNSATLTNLDYSFMYLASFSSSQALQWITRVGCTSGRLEEVNLVVGKDDYLYVTGTVSNNNLEITSSIDFYDTTSSNIAASLPAIQILESDTYSKSQIFLAKYSKSGVFQWATHVDNISLFGFYPSIALDSQSNIYLSVGSGDLLHVYDSANNSSSVSSINAVGEYSSIVMKYTTNGIYQWATRMTGSDNGCDYTHVSCDKEDNIYVTSESNASQVDVFNQGDLGTSVFTIPSFEGSWYNYIVKFNPAGEYIWATRFGGANDSYYSMTATDSQSNLYFLGVYNGATVYIYSASDLNTVVDTMPNSGVNDIALIKYDKNGVYQWATRIAGTGDDREVSLTIDKDDRPLVLGYINETNQVSLYNAGDLETSVKTIDFPYDYSNVVVKYSSSGQHLWSSYLTNVTANLPYYSAIQTDSNGTIYVAGQFDSSGMDVYNPSSELVFSMEGTDSTNNFTVRFNSDGVPLSGFKFINTSYSNIGTTFRP